MTTPTTRRRDSVAGARAMAPWLLGVAPFGMVIGISAARADVPTLAGVLTGPVIYSGSSQVATIELLDAGATPIVVVGTALVINLRLILYSAGMAIHWRGTPWWWRAAAAYLLIDPSFAVGVDGYARWPERGRAHAYYLGGAVVLWVGWLAAIVAGAFAGARLPDWLHLEFVIPLYLIGEIVPKLRWAATPPDRRSRRGRRGRRVLRTAASGCGHRDRRRARRRPDRSPATQGHRGGAGMNAWLAILAVGLGSYLFRIGFVAMADRIAMPALDGARVRADRSRLVRGARRDRGRDDVRCRRRTCRRAATARRRGGSRRRRAADRVVVRRGARRHADVVARHRLPRLGPLTWPPVIAAATTSSSSAPAPPAAATALLLARLGHDVVVVDRATFPSDTLSTHSIARSGVVQLRRWGLLDAVLASGAPAIRQVSFHADGESRSPGRSRTGPASTTWSRPGATSSTRSWPTPPRAAGADVRFGVTVTGGPARRRRPGRSASPGTTAHGAAVELDARFVVGADGLRSRVARAVGAPVVERSRPPAAPPSTPTIAGLPLDGIEFYVAERRARRRLPHPRRRGLRLGVQPRPTLRLRPAARAGSPARRPSTRVARPRTAPALADRLRAAHRTSPVAGMLRHPQPGSAALRPRLGAGRRRRLPPRRDHRARHQRRLPRRRTAGRRARRGPARRAPTRRPRWPATAGSGTRRCARSSTSPARWPPTRPCTSSSTCRQPAEHRHRGRSRRALAARPALTPSRRDRLIPKHTPEGEQRT